MRARRRGNPLDAMETCLSLDSTNRELQLAFKKTLRHSSGLQFKVDGVLNTVTTDSRATAKLSKVARGCAGRGNGGGLRCHQR